MIEAQALSRNYGAVRAVRGVSFSVGSGEIVGLLGPNGAGKTTIMKILTGYHYPTSGTATIDGLDVTAEPVKVKSSIGYLPENAPVYEDLTVAEYLDFVADSRELTGELADEAISRAVGLCSIGDHLHRPIHQLSRGYRQRVGLAQAILHNPRILILDEPTSGLDPNQIQEIRRLIRDLGRDKTVILSTHILQEVEAVCDRVLILNEGRIVAAGTTEEIGRGLKGETVYTIDTETPLPDAARKALATICNDVSSDQPVRVSLHAGKGGADLFRWATANDVVLTALVPERFSLEDIFTRLTTSAETEESE